MVSAVATWPASSSSASRSLLGDRHLGVAEHGQHAQAGARGPMPTRAALAKPRARSALSAGSGALPGVALGELGAPRRAGPARPGPRAQSGPSRRRRRPRRGRCPPPPARRPGRPPGSGPPTARGPRPRADRGARGRPWRRRPGAGRGCARRRARARCRWFSRLRAQTAATSRSAASAVVLVGGAPHLDAAERAVAARAGRPRSRARRRCPRRRSPARRAGRWPARPTRRPPRAPVAARAAAEHRRGQALGSPLRRHPLDDLRQPSRADHAPPTPLPCGHASGLPASLLGGYRPRGGAK